jgi:hypothetical protein
LDYLAALADRVPLAKWKRIVTRAVKDAEQGDPRARRWLGEHLLGRQTEGLTALAVTELAGTADDDIRAEAAGLRANVFRKKVLNRVSSYPDLNPDRSAGSGDIGNRVPDLDSDRKAHQPSRNGYPGQG